VAAVTATSDPGGGRPGLTPFESSIGRFPVGVPGGVAKASHSQGDSGCGEIAGNLELGAEIVERKHGGNPNRAGPNPYTRSYREERERILTPDAVCYLCGLPPAPDDPLEADHVLPLSMGGTHRGNLKPARVPATGVRVAAVAEGGGSKP
jgi:hypothetical protein